MMSDYLFWTGSLGLLASIVSLSAAGLAFRRRFVRRWKGPAALLAVAIAALSIATVEAYVLGSVGMFRRTALLAVFIATGPLAWLILRPFAGNNDESDRPNDLDSLLLAIGGFCLFTIWMAGSALAYSRGITDTDPLWYQLPTAARFVQYHSLLGIHFSEVSFQTYFFPATGSMFHAFGMAFFKSDLLTPIINVCWVALALLAGAAIGNKRGVGAASTLGVAVLMATPTMIAGEAGSGKTDAPSAALFAAAVAIWLNSELEDGRGPLVLAGLAAGLALSVKLTVAIPIVLLTLAVIWVANRGDRVRTGAIWIGSAAITGSFWFLRNLIATGSPVPSFQVPLLPNAGVGVDSEMGHPIAYYFDQFHVLTKFWPKAITRLGEGWPFVIALTLLGAILLIAKAPSKRWRAAGLLALGCAISYFFTPETAAGPADAIKGLSHLRYAAPAMILGLSLLPIGLDRIVGRQKWILTAVPFALLVVTVFTKGTILTLFLGEGIRAAGIIVVAVAVIGCCHRRIPLAIKLAIAVALGAVALPAAQDLTATYALGTRLNYRKELLQTPPTRIGLSGTQASFTQYRLFGPQLQNRIEFLGVRGPHGSFRPTRTCAELFAAINQANVRYVYASPDRDVFHLKTRMNDAPKWLTGAPGVQTVERITGYIMGGFAGDTHETTVFRINGRLDPAWCSKFAPGTARQMP